MESMIDILERQHAVIEFNDGKVKYFSTSTQWDSADTIKEAVGNIVNADKKLNGKSPLGSAIDKLENEYAYKNERKLDMTINDELINKFDMYVRECFTDLCKQY